MNILPLQFADKYILAKEHTNPECAFIFSNRDKTSGRCWDRGDLDALFRIVDGKVAWEIGFSSTAGYIFSDMLYDSIIRGHSTTIFLGGLGEIRGQGDVGLLCIYIIDVLEY